MKVRANARYLFIPNLLDRMQVCAPNLKNGDVVTVVKLYGCPPPNAMGMCHVNGPDGKFAGMVSCNSLSALPKGRA